MKILMATMGLDIGGAETHIVELAKEFKRQGHEVVAASNGGVYVSELEKIGIRHYNVPMHRRSISLILKSYFLLGKILKKEKPDVVHAHARIPAMICGLLQGKGKFTFVTTCHGVYQVSGVLKMLSNWGERTIAVSEDVKKYLVEQYGIPEEQIPLTINGIDTERFSPDVSGECIREEFSLDRDTVIGHVSRLDRESSLAARLLIEAAPRINERIPNVRVLITGGGDVYQELHSLARKTNSELGRECIVFTGPRTDIDAIAAASDIFVGVSRAALEAMAEAKPVILCGAQGYDGLFTAELLEHAIDTNFCCRGRPVADVVRFADDITDAVNMTAEEKAKVGDYGREVVLKHYSVKTMAADAMMAYRTVQKPKKILMSGYYGFSNAGDDAILASVFASVKRSAPDAEITILSNNPRATAEMYKCSAVNRFSPFKVCSAIRKCNLLISGGGSLLQDKTSTRSLLYYLFIIRLAEIMGKKVMLYANGIGPVDKKRNRRIVGKTCNAADVITLRDKDSLRELQDMKVTRPVVEVTADPVYLLEPADASVAEKILTEAGAPTEGFIAVSVRYWEGMKKFASKMAAVCDRIYEKYGKKIVFISMHRGTDANAAMTVGAKMKAPFCVIDGAEPLEIMAVIAKADIMVSMRLHSVIFAAHMRVPVAGIAYDPKVASSLEMLAMPSLGTVKDFKADDAVEVISKLYENRTEMIKVMDSKFEELSEKAHKNEEYIKKILE